MKAMADAAKAAAAPAPTMVADDAATAASAAGTARTARAAGLAVDTSPAGLEERGRLEITIQDTIATLRATLSDDAFARCQPTSDRLQRPKLAFLCKMPQDTPKTLKS